MYLGYYREFLNLVAANPPKNFSELFVILGLMFKGALTTAKALWFFLLNLRVFITGPEGWYCARLVSAFCGVATIGLTYLLARRYFRSTRIALLSALFLALLPSHVFYSRLGMQESLSALLFLGAIYLYLFPSSISWRIPVSAFLLSCVFFTNYRMIIAPVFLVAIELFESFKDKQPPQWKKLMIGIGVFVIIVWGVGSLYGGVNRYVTFGWMTHQAQEAQGQRNLLSLFSYPYYVFALEGILFALLFWANTYFVVKKQWSKLFPFILVLIQMIGFSLAAEKGARYLCVVLPFMAVAAAVSADFFLNSARKKIYGIIIAVVCLGMTIESWKIAISSTDYAKAVHIVLAHDPKAKMLSTQFLVEQLYVKDEKIIKDCPKNLSDFIILYQQGYHYLILDPQAYISWTKDAQRFSPPLIDFLEFIRARATPLVVLDHLNAPLLKRFVLDHNQNLTQSIKFLSSASGAGHGQIRIYDIGQCLLLLKQQAI